jgi:hypothetical protein
VGAATLLVWPDSPIPTPPYADWATAAQTIQDAVDAAQAGDTVLVTNGVYATGGRAVVGTMTNRVAVDKPVEVRSVNGPAVTVIEGCQVPGTTNGDGAIRCAYLTNCAVLSGFTLTYGATRRAGDYHREQSGGGVWCESTNALVTNCALTGNSAEYGGGADNSTLNNCTLMGNSASQYGGGASGGTLNNCTLTRNSAGIDGGGACWGTLNNCALTGNSASQYGGGASGGTLNNCILYYNTADTWPNHYYGTLNYCCTTPAPTNGVGNLTAEPQLASTSHLSTGSPCRGAGSAAYATGLDIDGEAWLNPPSIGCDEYRAGAVTGPLTVAITARWTNVAVRVVVDLTGWIDGRASASVWNFGDGTVVSNRPYASHAWVAPGDYPVVLRAYNESHPDGVSATVTIRVETQPVHYVSVASANPVPPYGTWETAARTIQDAVDAAAPGDMVLVTNGVYDTGGRAVVGLMTNRVAVDKPVDVRSVNGPEVTVIEGYQVPGTTNGDGAIRCVYLAGGAVLSGFTLAHGATRIWVSGGGVWCESTNARVTNCTLTGNSASDDGGGACSGTLNNCTLTGNSASYSGGGAYRAALNNCAFTGNSADYGGGVSLSTNGMAKNCTFAGNSAKFGGGAYSGTLNNCAFTGNSASDSGGGAYRATLNNCILYYNTAHAAPDYDETSGLNYCCTTPLPASGAGNITNAPLFVDPQNGNLRLQPNSPCINAGNNAYAPGTLELDGNPRIVGGTVDIGAYEFQTPASVLSYAWLQQYGLSTDGSADFTDPDGDHLNNWQEWLCGTIPTNTLSVLRLLTPVTVGSNLVVSWESVAGRTYFLERSPDLGASPAFLPLATGIPGQAGTNTFTDTTPPSPGPSFYRVGILPQ